MTGAGCLIANRQMTPIRVYYANKIANCFDIKYI